MTLSAAARTFKEWNDKLTTKPKVRHRINRHRSGLPSAADLDAVAEEQRVKELTSRGGSNEETESFGFCDAYPTTPHLRTNLCLNWRL